MGFEYITKPVTVQAVSTEALNNFKDTVAIPQWVVAALFEGTLSKIGGVLTCMTRNGPVGVNPTDMLIRLDDGEIYPCALEVFKKKYEPVSGIADVH